MVFIISQILTNTNPNNNINRLGADYIDVSVGFIYFMEFFTEPVPRIKKLDLLNSNINWDVCDTIPEKYIRYIENNNQISGKENENLILSMIIKDFFKKFIRVKEIKMDVSLCCTNSIQIFFLKNENVRQKVTDLYLKNRGFYEKGLDFVEILQLQNLRSLTLNVEDENIFLEIFKKIRFTGKIQQLSIMKLNQISHICAQKIEKLKSLKSLCLKDVSFEISSSGILKSKNLQMRLQELKIWNYYKFDHDDAEQIGHFPNLKTLELFSCIFLNDALSLILTNENLVNSLENLNLRGSSEILRKHVHYLSNFKSLRYLDLTDAVMKDDVRKSIANNTNLKPKINELAI